MQQTSGGIQLARYNDELAQLTIQSAEDIEGEKIIERQLLDIDSRIKQAAIRQTQNSKTRLITQRLEHTESRLDLLKSRASTLSNPTVTVLGTE